MSFIQTKVKTFNKTSPSDVEDDINAFTKNAQVFVTHIDIKPFESMNGLRYLGVVTYQTQTLLDNGGQQQ